MVLDQRAQTETIEIITTAVELLPTALVEGVLPAIALECPEQE